MVKAKKYVIVKHFVDNPKPTDLELIEEELPELQPGEYLVEAEFLSVDPYMRLFINECALGSTMMGSQVAKIVESRNPKYPVGKRIIGYLGWRTHTVINPDTPNEDTVLIKRQIEILPEIGDLPSSLGLGVLGMPGNTAYFGFFEMCKPNPGETIVVSSAAGTVGSLLGQMAKNMGLTVIGICGSDEKCKWLTDELNFDYAINYKTESIEESLRKIAPQGIDCYFDNVGGEISSKIMYQMKTMGRVVVCGSTSSYNSDFSCLPRATIIQPMVLFNQLTIQGFIIFKWNDRWLEGIYKNLNWIQEGKLKYRETVTKGFENMFEAFQDLLGGKCTGKAIVQV